MPVALDAAMASQVTVDIADGAESVQYTITGADGAELLAGEVS
jgi:hypothetical protein